MKFLKTDYLGDGVYGMFDGYSIWLYANDHKQPTDKICLEPSVLTSLNNFAKQCKSISNDETPNENVPLLNPQILSEG